MIGSLIADAEIISLALEVAQELPWLRNKSCTIRLGHTKLLEGLLLHHGIDTKYHESIKKTLSEIKVFRTFYLNFIFNELECLHTY